MSMLLETANQIHQFQSLVAAPIDHTNVVTLAADYTAPEIEWNPSDDMKKGARKAAFILAVVWLFFLLLQHAVPSKRGGRMGGGGGGGKYFAVGFLIVLLLDLSLVPTVVNYILKVAWWGGSLFGLTDSDAGIG